MVTVEKDLVKIVFYAPLWNSIVSICWTGHGWMMVIFVSVFVIRFDRPFYRSLQKSLKNYKNECALRIHHSRHRNTNFHSCAVLCCIPKGWVLDLPFLLVNSVNVWFVCSFYLSTSFNVQRYSVNRMLYLFIMK